MPIELGRFISDAMYESKLNSHSENVKGTACIRAINVRKGKEELDGSSWKVSGECQVSYCMPAANFGSRHSVS